VRKGGGGERLLLEQQGIMVGTNWVFKMSHDGNSSKGLHCVKRKESFLSSTIHDSTTIFPFFKSILLKPKRLTMAESNSVEIFLLKIKLDEQQQRIKFLQDKKVQLEQQVNQCEEFQQRLINYLLLAANEQEQLQQELNNLKKLILESDVKKRRKKTEFNEAIEQINESLHNLSLFEIEKI
jgi:septal ring factor EnvC (AmiA/AmiB activator)